MYDVQIVYDNPAVVDTGTPAGMTSQVSRGGIAGTIVPPGDNKTQDAFHNELKAALGRLNIAWDNVVSVHISRRTTL